MKRIQIPRQRVAVMMLGTWALGELVSPGSLRAQSPAANTQIQHVVVIFQENVSFDHYFGTYPVAANSIASEPVFTALPNSPSVNGLAGPLLTNNPNSRSPFRLTRAQAVTCDQGHGYTAEQTASNAGLMNKFVEAVGVGTAACDVGGYGKGVVMGYYDGNTVSGLWNYAQNFAMSDNFFNTQFGPSTPGALNLIAGQTHGATLVSGSPGGNVSGATVIGDPRPALDFDDCTIKTAAQIKMVGKNVGDLLNAKNLSWGWFQGGFRPSSMNADGTAVCATAHANVAGATPTGDYIPHHEPFMYYQQTSNPHHLPPTSVAKIGQMDQANHQYDMLDFTAALAAGNLPAVSFLKAPAYQDGHAGYSDPLNEQTFLVNTINALMQSPFWSSTAIFITYDDSDGWYDHVMAPVVMQSTTADDALTGVGACGSGSAAVYQARCGYGPRLPLVAISPFAKVNYVDHALTDQSSILRFIEDNWSLGRIGDSSMDAVSGSLLGMFDFKTPAAKAVFLDPSTGSVSGSPAGGGKGPGAGVTKAVANPKSATVTQNQYQLDGSASTSFDGKPLTYFWTLAPGSPSAAILGATTATPTVQFSSTNGLYSFVLTVTDSTGQTATDTAAISYSKF